MKAKLSYTNNAADAAVRPTPPPAPRKAFSNLDAPRTIQRVLKPEDTSRLRQQIEQMHPKRIILVLSHTDFSDPELLTRQLIESRMELVSERPSAGSQSPSLRFRSRNATEGLLPL